MRSYQSSAALTGSLLSRKGAAAPSGSVTSFLDEVSARQPDRAQARGRTEPQQESCSTTSTGGDRAKLSVRLDQDRHLRLKLAAAHLRHSSQRIMLDALDAYLAKIGPAISGDCVCLSRDG